MVNKNRKKKGQSTIEYIILVTGVVALLVAFLGNNQWGFRSALNTTLRDGTNGMQDMADRLGDSRYRQFK